MTAPGPGAHGHGPGPALDGALAAFARRATVLVALDFDGVLAPLVLDPATARPLPRSREALGRLAALDGVRLALVSGRRLDDLRRYADPPAGTALAGSHGAEVQLPGGSPVPAPLDERGAALLERVRRELLAVAARHPGTTVEVKPTGAVLHTRAAERPVAQAAAQEVLAGPATWPGVHPTPGKEVVELAVTDATKGAALQALRTALGVPGPGGVLYAGDDVTDERAFAVLDDAAGDVTVKVGDGPTAARHRVRDPEAVADLLAGLADRRAGVTPP